MIDKFFPDNNDEDSEGSGSQDTSTNPLAYLLENIELFNKLEKDLSGLQDCLMYLNQSFKVEVEHANKCIEEIKNQQHKLKGDKKLSQKFGKKDN